MNEREYCDACYQMGRKHGYFLGMLHTVCFVICVVLTLVVIYLGWFQ